MSIAPESLALPAIRVWAPNTTISRARQHELKRVEMKRKHDVSCEAPAVPQEQQKHEQGKRNRHEEYQGTGVHRDNVIEKGRIGLTTHMFVVEALRDQAPGQRAPVLAAQTGI